MKLECKIYETHSQKIGDFFLGIVLFVAVTFAFIFGLHILFLTSDVKSKKY